MPEILFFTSPIGLGHAARTAAISHYLEGASKKFVTGSGAYRLFREYGLDAADLYRPPPFRVENGRLQRPLGWLLSYLSFYKRSKSISSGLIETERPRVVVSDEDFGSLVSAQKRRVSNVLVTDILETRFATGPGAVIERMMNRGMKKIISKCDLVIVPETGDDAGNIVRVGPIVRETSQSRQSLREKYSFGRKTVVVTTGGTDLGRFLIERAVEVFRGGRIDADLVIVSGPTLQMGEVPYRNMGFASRMHEVIFASDLVISLAGKSTIDESVHYGTPGIFIPIKGHFEQEDNARELGYSYEDIFRLEELVNEKLGCKREPRPFEGARRAADLIKKFCS